jgi:nucleoside-diphosphate-sugar epimerase
MRILVLGGTAFLGRAFAEAALARGHELTCLARGTQGGPPEGATHVVADRTSPTAYDDVVGRSWDAVLDIGTQPGFVRRAVDALVTSVDRYLYVSTVSVYADDSVPGADEEATTHEPLLADELGSMAEYGSAKVACEHAVLEKFGPDRSLIARAGLIGGPGDHTGRTGYWPWRFAHPATDEGAVLVPEDQRWKVALIDVRDLADWLVRCAERGTTGIFNALANGRPLSEHLTTARELAGHRGPVVTASTAWLEEHGVGIWMGPKSLPLWLPSEEYAGHGTRSVARAEAAGLSARPLAETLADVLAWEEGQEHPRSAGLSDQEERELIEALRHTSEG